MDKFKVIRIFIGSPGGLAEEREAALKVLDEVNRANSEHWQCHFKLFGWENTIPGYVRPQSKINEDLDKCKYFIGVLWNRWGSKPSTDPDGYTSGFEEEYVRAEQRIHAGQMKDLALYFKHVDVPTGFKPDDELEKVITFRQKCIDEKRPFFKDFSDLNEFRDLVREKLIEIGWQETEIFADGSQKNNDAEQTPPPTADAVDTSSSTDYHLLDPEAIVFLSDICKRSSDWDQTQPFDVARFRLIASAVSRQGNDDRPIGNHDANLIYRFAEDGTFSRQEYRALVDCGIHGFENQNVPLWRWLAASAVDGDDPFERVRWHAIVGDKQEQKQALKILDRAAQPIPALSDLTVRDTLNAWFFGEKDESAFTAILQFLTSNAREEDIPLIDGISASLSEGRKEKVEAAVVGILAKSSAIAAINRVLSVGISLLDSDVVGAIFSQPELLDTGTLIECLAAKPDNLRLEAAKLLFLRDEIPLDQAQALVSDGSLEIRFVAAERLRKLGHPLSADLLKKALTVERQRNALLFNAFAPRETDSTFLNRYEFNRLSEMTLQDLRKETYNNGALAGRDLGAMYKTYARTLAPEIRQNLQDGFAAYYADGIATMEAALGPSATRSEQMRKLEDFTRNTNTTYALEALCSLGKREDLPLVRQVIDTMKVDASDSVLTFLGKFGQWSDVPRISALGDGNQAPSGILITRMPSMPENKAAAIVAVGKERVSDVLKLTVDPSIRRAIARVLPLVVISRLNDDILLQQFNNEDDRYRVIFALKCVLALSKLRLKALLDRYLTVEDKRYYNSVHWLDLGRSFPTDLARTIARRHLLTVF
ncbi:DUF4062 domain-containing protein [Asticcacaulis excentricus]|uniref:DUF4062 domain-containing protein n=1 Tax=Asticcacaulis excentricus (strain ATCC 15261 / DSM 4724 / KCTC 12464 / NCIMB 9791 / VKM B-1370 / CB 48) TaxID=573065 RepID=E8RUN8_ASTEC|nr:DUF4062 domain-containing protein [Asticcacaulis excentricus]ADU14088.1 hypothetical protein Astex_2437 [Asticcacaulis excentricus CB 48]